jgi:radical SAM superfamily enzyme YgiQ (UPF0313 family)
MNLLIKPASFIMIGQSPPPLGLLYMASMDEDTQILDMVFDKRDVWHIIEKEQPKVVGVQMYSTSRHDSLDLLKRIKSYGCITVAGGPHASVMAKQLESEYDFIDHIVVGDGETAWEWLTLHYTDSPHKWEKPPKIIRELVMDLDQLPIPAWDKIDINKYARDRINVVMGRGCDGQCTFCSAWWVNGKYRHHSFGWIYEHLEKLWNLGVRHLRWQDDCLTNSKEATTDLISALSHFNFKSVGTTRVDMVTKQQIEALKGVGFYSLGFGIESGSQTILNMINKRTDLEQALKVRQWCKDYGVQFKALMMQGFPFETPETRREDREFRVRLHPDEWGTVGHIIVLPGTKLYRDLKKEGKIDDSFWLGSQPYYKLG